MRVDSAGVNHLGPEFVQRPHTQEAHVHLELVAEDLDCLLHAFLPVRAERIQEWPPDADRARAKRERLEHVARAAHAAVDEDVEVRQGPEAACAERGGHLDEDFEARARGVELPSAVVGEDDAVDAGLVGEESVFRCGDALEDDGHW